MSMSFVLASQATSVWLKILLYGNSGSGKTWRSVQARRVMDQRKVLALLTEANGVQSARHSNPSVLLPSWPVLKTVKDEQGNVTTVQSTGPDGKPEVRHYAVSMAEVRDVLRAVINREIPGLDVLVCDGLTEIQAMMKDEMIGFKEAAVRDGRAKKGTEIFSQADWGELNEKMRRFMRTLRDAPLHVVCTALADVEVEEDGESRTRYTMPSFQGRKLHNQAAAFQTVVAYCYTSSGRSESGARKISRLAMVEGPETIQCKPAHPLRGVLEIPLHKWMDLLESPPEQPVGRELTAEEREDLEKDLEKGAEETSTRKSADKPLPEPGDAGADTKSADDGDDKPKRRGGIRRKAA